MSIQFYCTSSIAVLHILVSGSDQFVANLFLRKGQLHQVLRDIAFLIPDLFHLILPYLELKKTSGRQADIKASDIAFATASVLALWIVSAFIP